ncbi:Allantoicase [Nadsonia fulvescens var. elongata DSM 6958]|uniref:allantoicase n=1 Tax=Nadsonia fulvescens var. elongata DSM 6958 TaxID=857566 RepID=A0A1E3PGJ0_9ASCO|nr:Allantoicase [Nadsonia fulvescens var. elongata DSM 6958]
MSIQSQSEQEFYQNVATKYTDVIGRKLGGHVVLFSDEFFAEAANLIKPTPPIRDATRFVPTGAWYDGWETRRHNTAEADWVIIKLGVASARIIGAEIDTAFFNGNEAPAISIQGTFVSDQSELGSAQWKEIVPLQKCGPSARHFFVRDNLTSEPFTHVKLLMYPDGGIARFRLYGVPTPVFPEDINVELDLAHVSSGGVAVSVSNQHFGTADNLLLPGRGHDMSDGWETARSRAPGHIDWVIIKLGAKGIIDRVIVDTANFMGNFPQKVRVQALSAESSETEIKHDDSRWVTILDDQKTQAHTEHEFKINGGAAYTHAKLVIIPDGGVKRFRVLGRRAV